MKLEYSRKILAQEMAETRLGSFSNIAEQWKLGWYTDEQEADELGIEWLSYLGFNPRLMGDGDLGLLKFDGERVPWEECVRQREGNWFGEGNQPIVLAWGPLDDLHPKSCFRVNNSDREIMTHKYPIPTRSPSEGLRPTWGQLVAGIGGVIEPEFEDNEESDDAETEVATSALTKLKASCRHHPVKSKRHRKSKSRQI